MEGYRFGGVSAHSQKEKGLTMKRNKSLFFKSLAVILSLCLVVVSVRFAVAANTKGVISYGARGIKVGIPGLQLTSEETAPTDSGLAAGRIYYDTTSGFLVYNGATWDTINVGTAGSADSVYNVGAWTVDVNANDVIFRMSSTSYNLLFDTNVTGTSASLLVLDAKHNTATVTDAIEITTSGSSAVVTNALDVSDAGIVNALTAGANDLSGTLWSVTGATGAAVFVGVTSGTGDVNVGTSKLIIAGATGKITGGAAADIDLNSMFTVDATQGNTVVEGTLDVTGALGVGSFAVDTITATTTNTALTLNGNGTHGVVLQGTGAGGVTCTTDLTCTADIDIDGGDITCPADLTITPTGGDVDINAADLWLDSGKAITFDGTSHANYIQLSTSLQMIATGDILLDPAGADVDIDGADLWIDGGNMVSLNGSTGTNNINFTTYLNIVGTAGIVLDTAAGDIDVDVASVFIDSGEKLSVNGSTNTATFYLSTDVKIDSPTDVVITPTGGQVDFNACDIAVDTGKKIGLNGIGALTNDYLYLNTNVTLDGAAKVIIQGGGNIELSPTGDVDVSAGSVSVDAAEHFALAGLATVKEAAFIYQNSAVEVFCNETNIADFTATNMVVEVGTVEFFGQTRKEVLHASTGVILDGAAPPALTTAGTDGVAGKNIPVWAFQANAGADDIVTLVWNVPDGYKTDSARLNIGWSFSDAETNDDDVTFDFAITSCAQGTAAAAGDAWDVAGTAFTEGDTNIDTGADADKLMVTQLNIEELTIEVDDTVLISFWVDASASDLTASETCDIHFFEIEWESTE